MKTRIHFLAVLLAITAFCLSGCSTFKLPEVQGQQVTYRRTDPIGGVTIEAKNVKVTEKYVTAEHASWSVTYPQFTMQLTVDGYKRKRDVTESTVPDDK